MNPALASDTGTMADLSWQNFIKEVFLDSETAIGLISTPPGPYPQEAVVPPKEMTHIRDEINRITQSRRMLAHGLVTPQLGQTDLDFMADAGRDAEDRRVEGLHRLLSRRDSITAGSSTTRRSPTQCSSRPASSASGASASTRACRWARSPTTTIRAI